MDEISDQYISTAIDNLVKLIGVKDYINADPLVKLLNEGLPKKCIEEIAKYLGLPIKVNLVYVPDNYRGTNSGQNFSSNSLVKTDGNGKGKGGIIAQVSIPEYLPMFGTVGLDNFPIDVKISYGVTKHPKTFIAIMSHELSHILLGTLCSKEKSNEIYTDLTSMLSGFNQVIKEGRKTEIVEYKDSPLLNNLSSRSYNKTTITTYTTTFGYFSDYQFNFAYYKILKILDKNKRRRDKILEKIDCTQNKIKVSCDNILNIKKIIFILDNNPKVRKKKLKKDISARVIMAHQIGYLDSLENKISYIKGVISEYEKAIPQNHFYDNWVDKFNKIDDDFKNDIFAFDDTSEQMKADLEALKKSIKFFYRACLFLGIRF